MASSAAVIVSYSQLAVFDPRLEKPFNDWTPQHVDQGFAWRPGSVSFGTLGDGPTTVAIHRPTELTVGEDAIRAIRVPFSVPETGTIEIASISDGFQTRMLPGSYLLQFETGRGVDARLWCRLTFVPGLSPVPEIVRADGELKPGEPLLMTAAPA